MEYAQETNISTIPWVTVNYLYHTLSILTLALTLCYTQKINTVYFPARACNLVKTIRNFHGTYKGDIITTTRFLLFAVTRGKRALTDTYVVQKCRPAINGGTRRLDENTSERWMVAHVKIVSLHKASYVVKSAAAGKNRSAENESKRSRDCQVQRTCHLAADIHAQERLWYRTR